ncbi:MAG: DUF308 domain-containing protein [Candidatus Nanopelagicales bacterium]
MTTTNNLTPAGSVPDDHLVATSKHWGVLLGFGILTGGLGAAIIAWPEKSLAIAGVLLGLSLLVSGVFSVVASFTQPDRSGASRVLIAISGVISVALGLIAFQGITQAITILVIVIGVGWLTRGLIELIAGIDAPRGLPGRGLTITSGVIGLTAGVVILVWPSITLTVLVWIVGLTLILIGIVQVVAAFALRSVGQQLVGRVTLGEVVTD